MSSVVTPKRHCNLAGTVQADGEDGHVSDSAALASYLQQMKLDRAGQKDGSRTGEPSRALGGPSSPCRHDPAC